MLENVQVEGKVITSFMGVCDSYKDNYVELWLPQNSTETLQKHNEKLRTVEKIQQK